MDAITPDTKNWTWVLERACPECGFDTAAFPREAVVELLIDVTQAWHEVLTGPGEHRTRPRPDVWSPLEYGCHVRDVYGRFDERLRLMLETDDPHYPDWNQNQTALDDRYDQQDPDTVAVELAAAGEALAGRFATVSGPAWQRTGNRSDGARFTVESFARYFIHDPVHHLYDVTGVRAS
jgi:hypothetical protein